MGPWDKELDWWRWRDGKISLGQSLMLLSSFRTRPLLHPSKKRRRWIHQRPYAFCICHSVSFRFSISLSLTVCRCFYHLCGKSLIQFFNWFQDCGIREVQCPLPRRWKAAKTTRNASYGTWCAATSATSGPSRTPRRPSSSSWASLWLKSSTW